MHLQQSYLVAFWNGRHRTAVPLEMLKAGRRSIGVAGVIIIVTDAMVSLAVDAE